MGFVSKLNERVVNIMSKTRSILNTSTASDREANNLKTQTENLNKEIADVESSLRAEINSSHDMNTRDHLYSLRINLDDAKEALGKNLERIFSERGMNSSGNQVSVPMPSKFDGTGSVSKYMEWRQSVRNFLNFKQCSAEFALKQYKECFTTSEAKEAISELTSVDNALFTLDRRYYNKSALVSELTNDLTSIQPPGARPESAARYVSNVLTRLKRVIRISKEAGVENHIAPISIEQMLLEHLFSTPTLAPYATAYAEESGRLCTDINFSSSANKMKLLVNMLEEADQALIIFRSNSYHHTPNASRQNEEDGEETSRGEGEEGGRERGKSQQEKVKDKALLQTDESTRLS